MNADKVATYESISSYFGTSDLTTHRILSNCNLEFFQSHFGDNAQQMWNEAHPSRDYSSFSIKFIEKHFDLFSKRQFITGGGSWQFNPKINKMDWAIFIGYVDIEK